MPACPLCDSKSNLSVSLVDSALVNVHCPSCGDYRILAELVEELKSGPEWNEMRKHLSKAVSWAARQQQVTLETARDVNNLNKAFKRSERKPTEA